MITLVRTRDAQSCDERRHALWFRGASRFAKWTLLVALLITATSGCQSFRQFARNPFVNNRDAQTAAARELTLGGLDALNRGRLAQAESLLSRAASHCPDDQRIREHLATAFFERGDVDRAISQMQRAVECSGGDPKLHVRLGEMYFEKGQWLPATRQADLALLGNRQLASAWVLKGRTEFAKGNLKAALADFHRALSYQSDLPEVKVKIARVYQRLGQPLRALSAIEQMLSQYPEHQQPNEAILLESVVLMELQQFDQAIDKLAAASHREDASAEILIRLCQAQLLAGHQSQARLTLARAKQAYPDRIAELDQILGQLQPDNQDVAAIRN